jgi:hypothetical protein
MSDSEIKNITDELTAFLAEPLSPEDVAGLSYSDADNFIPRDHLTYLHFSHRSLRPQQHGGPRFNSYYQDKLSYGSPKDTKATEKLTAPTSREGHIHRRLGHIVVNPNDQFNTSAIVNSYCFLNATDPEIGDLPSSEIANLNPESAKAFIDRLIDIAERQTQIMKILHDRQGVALTQPRSILLHGQRGSGKTFFENFLLSRYSDYLDQRKVIWVRVNLVESIGYDDRLNAWINAQSAKIILRYFNDGSKYFSKPPQMHIDVDSYFREKVLPTKNKKERAEILRKLAAAKDHFFYSGHSETDLAEAKISEETIPNEVAQYVVAAARHQGFHFIVVLDGLDVLEITRAYRDRFDKLMSKSLELASTTERTGFALLLVTRTNTLRMILRHDYQDTYEQTEMEEITVQGMPLLKIIELRLRHLETEIIKMASGGVVDWKIDDIRQHLGEFKKFLHEKELIHGKRSEEEYLNLLEELQVENVRAKMQMLQYKYYDFLTKRHVASPRAPYQLVEALMKAGRRFPPIAYKYVLERGVLIRTIWNRQKFDTRFFPSVFRFPFVSGRFAPPQRGAHKLDGELKGANIEHVLMGIRILQFLRAMSKYYNDGQDSDRNAVHISVEELCECLKFAFDYEPSFVLRMLEEFSEYQLLEFQNPNLYATSRRLEDNEMVCLPKLDHMLNHFIYDIAYLNMAGMRVALPTWAFTAKAEPYFQAASYDEATDPLPAWVSAKVTNVSGLVRLLDAVNRLQEQRFRKRLKDCQDTKQEFLEIFDIAEEDGMFSFMYFLRDEVIKQFYLALKGISMPGHLMEAVGNIRRYIADWGSSPRQQALKGQTQTSRA